MPKNSKRGHSGSLNVFTNRKLQKKCKGLPSDRIRKFSKKKSHSAEKNPKGGPFGLTCCTFGSIKILWFSARIEAPLSGFRNLVEDEQQNRWTNCKKWTIQNEIVGWKKLPTVIVGLFSLREKAPTKNDRKQPENYEPISILSLKQFFKEPKSKTELYSVEKNESGGMDPDRKNHVQMP